MANNDKENKIKKFTKEAIGKTLNQFNKEIGMTDLVEVNKNQDRILNGILSQVNDESTEKTEKSNIITLDNSTDGIVELKEIQGDTNVNVSKIEEMPITHDIGDKEGNVFTLNEIPKGAISIGEIQGNTMVNCNKDDEKELVLMTDLSTQGDNNITLTEGVDGGKVDVALEGNTLVNVSKTKDNYITHESDEDTTGNHIALVDEGYIRPVLNGKTMVNVCDQKDPIAVTKSYTVENSGNHVVLQGDVDGSCRPVVSGNTLVNLWDKSLGYATTGKGNFIKENNGITVNNTSETGEFYVLNAGYISLLKPNTIYTLIIDIETSNNYQVFLSADEVFKNIGEGNTSTRFVKSFTSGNNSTRFRFDSDTLGGTVKFKDIMILEGDYTDKPIPDYFEGLKSTFEDKIVPENLVNMTSNKNISAGAGINIEIPQLKANTQYTIYSNSLKNKNIKLLFRDLNTSSNLSVGDSTSYNPFSGYGSLTTLKNGDFTNPCFRVFNNTSEQITLEDLIITEGDYTNYDFTDYDPTKLGKYRVDYEVTGKNKFDLSNLQVPNGGNFTVNNGSLRYYATIDELSSYNGYNSVDITLKLKPNTQYVFRHDTNITVGDSDTSGCGIVFIFKNNIHIETVMNNTPKTILTDETGVLLFKFIGNWSSTKHDFDVTFSNIQLEEGTEVTTYEPYKEYTKTLYLNSPLLEGDTIEEINGKATHVHNRVLRSYNGSEDWKYNGMIGDNCKYICNDYRDLEVDALSTICDKMPTVDYTMVKTVPVVCQNTGTGKPQILSALSTVGEFKSWLSSNPIRIVGKLTSPQYETISEDSIVCNSYVSGHLDFNTAVPIEKVEFKNTILENKYLYTNTEYTIQFEADKEGSAVISLGGTTLAETSIVKGLNKIAITTPETFTDNNLVLEGIGFNISDIVVTPTIEQDFGYFSGLSSTFEDSLVTDESDENYGKYKVEYKVTGKNKFKLKDTPILERSDSGLQISLGSGGVVVNGIATTKWNFLQIGSIKTSEKNKTYTLKYSQNKVSSTWHGFVGHAYLNGKKVKDKAISYLDKGDKYGDFKFTITTPNNLDFDEIVLSYTISWDGNLPYTYDNFILSNIQIEEGTEATLYEPHKEYVKTLNLNSPLLEGDAIEEINGGIYHVHRYTETMLDGSLFNNMDSDMNGLHRYYSYDYRCLNYALGENKCYCDKLPVSTMPKIDGSITFSGSGYIEYATTKSMNEAQEWLQQNSVIVVYELAEPQYELIEQSNLAIPSYANGHLDLASAVPVSKVNFLHFEEELTYLYPATSYTVQFISDKAITIDIALGGTQLLAQNIVKGLNRIIITTPETLVDNKLIIDGVGAKISKVVVTDTDREFKYFEGMKSVGECEELAITSANSDNTLSSTQQLTHEPLRAVGDVKDRYVLIDGKWYIERKCKEVVFDGSDDENWSVTGGGGSDTRNTFECVVENAKYINGTVSTPAMSNIVKYEAIRQIPVEDNCFRLAVSSSYFGYLLFTPSVDIIPYRDLRSWKAYLSNNPVVITYPLQTPVYEPLDYNPIEVYSEVTHITTNSAIPTNITIKNHGFNCLLKPSTTYTISSNLGINTVTTGADIGDSCLRFYDEDTSDKTTMKDVLILEGDWTSKANLIPSNFSGIESVFEQELVTDENDVNYDKYRVTARVRGKNLFDGELELGSINYNTGVVVSVNNVMKSKNYIEVKPSTLYTITSSHNKADVQYIFEYDYKKNFIKFTTAYGKITTTSKTKFILTKSQTNNVNGYTLPNNLNTNIQLEEGNTATAYEPYKENNITFYINEPLRGTDTAKDKVFIQDGKVVIQRNCGSVTLDGSDDEDITIGAESVNCVNTMQFFINNSITSKLGYKSICDTSYYLYLNSDDEHYYSTQNRVVMFIPRYKLQTQDIAGFKQWLQQHPTTVVYQLAEPTYEEVEYSSNRLILDTFNNESFNNSTLFLDTNISPKLSFKPLYEELVYVKSNTKYYIQFNAVGSGEVVINLGGAELTTEIVEGYNCIPITTPSESTNLMTIIGQGITISKVVVSEVICGGYYKGLQSCFEEHMENGKYRVLLRGIALDGSKVNGIKLYINEPLRGIGDIKDRLCIKNGKLMVEKKCGEAIFDGSNYIQSMDTSIDTKKRWLIYQDSSIKDVSDSQVTTINDKYCDISANDTWYNKEGISQNSMQHAIHIYLERYSDGSDKSKQALISELQQNPVKVVYQLAEPVYEEVINEYGLPIVFEGYENGIVYIDSAVTPTTHIKYTSNNQLATTLSEAEGQNIATQEDINMNVITYMMDIDMILTDMEISNDISVMAVRRDSSNENMLDRMSDEDKKVYRDNTVVMLEKMITAKVLDKEDIEGRINMYYDKNRISKEQYKYLKSLL